MTKKEIIRIIHDSAKKYCENLNGRNLLIVYQDSGVSVKTLEVSFTGTNFLHLTGVRTEKNASEFYSAALSGRNKENDFDIASDETTVLKMKVISSLLNGTLEIDEATSNKLRFLAAYDRGQIPSDIEEYFFNNPTIYYANTDDRRGLL